MIAHEIPQKARDVGKQLVKQEREDQNENKDVIDISDFSITSCQKRERGLTVGITTFWHHPVPEEIDHCIENKRK